MHGCNGHMGRVITDICKNDPEVTIVAGVDKFKGIDNEYPVFDSLAEVDVDYDVVIDFSTAAAVDGMLDVCEKNGKPVVLCTTGLDDKKAEKRYTKVVRDGKIYIERNGEWFNVLGAQVR